MINVTIIGQILWTGLATSSYQVLFAIAMALVLKVTQIWNFTQPGLMAIAFYVMFWALNSAALPAWAAIALAIAVTVPLAVAIEAWGFETFRRRGSPPMTFFIFTFIAAEFAIYLLTLLFGTEPVTLYPSIMSPVHLIGPIVVSDWDLRAIGTTALLCLALFLFLRYSRHGQFLIAVADNGSLAELYGISARQAYALSMALAAMLVTAAMFLFGTKLAAYPNTTLDIMVFAVAATILGGIGSVAGAAGAAVLINLLQQLSILVIPSRWQGFLLYIFLFLIIIFFPTGLKLPQRRRIADGRGQPTAPEASA